MMESMSEYCNADTSVQSDGIIQEVSIQQRWIQG